MYFSMYGQRVPIGSRASNTCTTISDESITCAKTKIYEKSHNEIFADEQKKYHSVFIFLTNETPYQ